MIVVERRCRDCICRTFGEGGILDDRSVESQTRAEKRSIEKDDRDELGTSRAARNGNWKVLHRTVRHALTTIQPGRFWNERRGRAPKRLAEGGEYSVQSIRREKKEGRHPGRVGGNARPQPADCLRVGTARSLLGTFWGGACPAFRKD